MWHHGGMVEAPEVIHFSSGVTSIPTSWLQIYYTYLVEARHITFISQRHHYSLTSKCHHNKICLSTHTSQRHICKKKNFVTKSSIVPVSQHFRFPPEIKSYILASNCVLLRSNHWTILISLFFAPQILPASISVGTSLLRPHNTFFASHNVISQKCYPTDSQRTVYVPIALELYHKLLRCNCTTHSYFSIIC